MKAPTAFTLAAALVLGLAAPAAAQSWNHQGPSRTWSSQGYYGGQGYARDYRSNRYGYDFNGQADRPGDYRCDAYWDAGRDDCGAAWRDQRPFVRSYNSGRYRSGYGYGHGYRGYGYGQAPASAYYGAYGRPDLVYPSGGYGGGYAGGRDSGRSAWCASRYRSYDPGSGYYRAYSGRLVFCG